MTRTDVKSAAKDVILRSRSDLLSLSHAIHARPEPAFEEHFACAAVAERLREAGYRTEIGVANLPTAFRATFGSGALQVFLCAEYDALPKIGHACGHNIIAASTVGAAIGLASVVDDMDATITVLGTPAEEQGGGKIIMLDHGIFDEAHLALMAHPSPLDLPYVSSLATQQMHIAYHGVAAHASVAPHRGVNAADALTIASTALGLLRQHLRPTHRVHGITRYAGDVPNVIPAKAVAEYTIRAATIGELAELQKRVTACFEAGALATGADLELSTDAPPYAEFRPHPSLTAAYVTNAQALGRRVEQVTEAISRAAGSTDLGNVSLTVPSIHPMVGVESKPHVLHQPGFADAARSLSGDQAVLDAATALAWTAIDAALDPELRAGLIQHPRETPGVR